MITPCQVFALCSAASAGAVIAIATYESGRQAHLPPGLPRQMEQVSSNSTIAAAKAQTAQWAEWHQETETEAAIEPLLPGLEDYAIDPSPMPISDRSDRASIQALLVIKLVADWLEGEAVNYGEETGQAIGQVAGRLRSMGLDVLEQ